MGSDQNPIHRDRGKRDQGDQPFKDSKEALGQSQAEIERHAPAPEDEGALSDEQFRREASERLGDAQDESRDQSKER